MKIFRPYTCILMLGDGAFMQMDLVLDCSDAGVYIRVFFFLKSWSSIPPQFSAAQLCFCSYLSHFSAQVRKNRKSGVKFWSLKNKGKEIVTPDVESQSCQQEHEGVCTEINMIPTCQDLLWLWTCVKQSRKKLQQSQSVCDRDQHVIQLYEKKLIVQDVSACWEDAAAESEQKKVLPEAFQISLMWPCPSKVMIDAEVNQNY